MRAAGRDTGGRPRIFTFYEDFFQDARNETNRLVRFCGLQAPHDFSIIHESISADLRHHSLTLADLLKKDEVAPEAKLFYAGLRVFSGTDFLGRVNPNVQESLVEENISRFLKVMEELQSPEKTADLLAALAEKNLQLNQMAMSLESIRSSLSWKFLMKLETIRDRLLPNRTRRRTVYNLILKSLKTRFSEWGSNRS